MKILKANAPLTSRQNEELLSLLPPDVAPDKILFFDIETTGFSRRYDSVYLMGYFYWEGRRPIVEQHLVSSTAEEIGLLENFVQKSEDFDLLMTYNGDAFDIPFVRERLRQMRIAGSLTDIRSMDLYKLYRPYASFFGWESCKLKSLERFLGLDRQDTMDGGELIEVFYEYSRSDDPGLEKMLLLHNYEDILNLPQLLKIEQYARYLRNCRALGLTFAQKPQEASMIFDLSEPCPFSHTATYTLKRDFDPITFKTDAGSPLLTLILPSSSDCLNYYLPNYKEYYILPSGVLHHKSLGVPPVKKAATRAECFVPKNGVFIPGGRPLALPGLHEFRRTYKDKNIYYEMEEVKNWTQEKDSELLSQFMHSWIGL